MYVPLFKATDAGYKPELSSCLALKVVFATLFFRPTRNLQLHGYLSPSLCVPGPVYKLLTSHCLAQNQRYYLYFSDHRFRDHATAYVSRSLKSHASARYLTFWYFYLSSYSLNLTGGNWFKSQTSWITQPVEVATFFVSSRCFGATGKPSRLER